MDETVDAYMKDRRWTKEGILEVALDEMKVFSSANSPRYKRLLGLNKRGVLTALRDNYPDEFIKTFWRPDEEDEAE